MKNTNKFIGIIALLAIIGFSMAACDDGDNNNNGSTSGIKVINNSSDAIERIAIFPSTADDTGWAEPIAELKMNIAPGATSRIFNLSEFRTPSGGNVNLIGQSVKFSARNMHAFYTFRSGVFTLNRSDTYIITITTFAFTSDGITVTVE